MPSVVPAVAVVRAARRVVDAEEEFDAALAAGCPLHVLVRREHELLLARAALTAAREASPAAVDPATPTLRATA